jgi:thiamine-phosphate pyrophosphorylase
VIARPRPCVYLVTARALVAPDARTLAGQLHFLGRWLDDAVAAGVDVIQVRERDLPPAALMPFVSELVARTRGTSTRVLVNDRSDVAAAARADGVHLRSDGPPVSRVRTLAPPPFLIGRSIHTAAEALTHRGADYLIFGTVFTGGSKPADAAVTGLDGLRAAVAAARTPVIAIGGITPERARDVVAAGGAGVAAITLFLPEGRSPGALGPSRAIEALRAAMDEGQKQR